MLKTSYTDQRLAKIADISLNPVTASLSPASAAERRDEGTRSALLHRVWDEFEEMPGTSLTLPQASRLFGIPVDMCDRILVSLVTDGRLRRTQDGRFRLRSFVA
jgi:hypothetical protein